MKQFWYDEDGQTLVEYGLLVSLIALVAIGALTLLGKRVSYTFNNADNGLRSTT